MIKELPEEKRKLFELGFDIIENFNEKEKNYLYFKLFNNREK